LISFMVMVFDIFYYVGHPDWPDTI
jgi:hypothetical protein